MTSLLLVYVWVSACVLHYAEFQNISDQYKVTCKQHLLFTEHSCFSFSPPSVVLRLFCSLLPSPPLLCLSSLHLSLPLSPSLHFYFFFSLISSFISPPLPILLSRLCTISFVSVCLSVTLLLFPSHKLQVLFLIPKSFGFAWSCVPLIFLCANLQAKEKP